MSAVAAPAPSTTRRPRRWRTLRRFVRHPGAFAAAVVLATIVILAIVAPWIVPYDWNETDLGARLGAPNAEFWFGTDLHGRDVFSRVVYGARYSISIGLATVTLSLLAGSFIGIVIGYAGGRIDEWGSRFIDVMLGFPQIVMAILVVSILGVGLVNVVLAVAIAGVPRFARVVRGAVLVVKEQPFIEAARALGAGDLRIMRRHLLPNAVPTLVVLGLFTRVAAVGMIGFVIVQTLTDIYGHMADAQTIGALFDRFPDSLISDQRLLWSVPLVYLALKGGGAISIDAILSRLAPKQSRMA